MKDKLGIERPHWGYFSEARVHETARPRPLPERPPVYEGALIDPIPDDVPRAKAMYGGRPFAF